MNKKRNITLMISMFITLLLITITLSFAYFTANISGTETGTTITVGAGTMNITYTNNTEVITASDIYPKNDPWITKKFTVQGNNTTQPT